MAISDMVKGFFGHPLVSLALMFVISAILLAQCVKTLMIAKKLKNPSEKAKKDVRGITGGTLVVCLILIVYSIAKFICTYTPAQYTVPYMLAKRV